MRFTWIPAVYLIFQFALSTWIERSTPR